MAVNGHAVAPAILEGEDLQRARQEKITFLETRGELDPACRSCQEHHYPYWRTQWRPGTGYGPHAPRHRPSPRCESGKRPHCTCDTCF